MEMSEQKIFENKDMFRVLALVVGLGGVSMYFCKKNNELRKCIEQLSVRIDEHDEKFDTIIRILEINRLIPSQQPQVQPQVQPLTFHNKESTMNRSSSLSPPSHLQTTNTPENKEHEHENNPMNLMSMLMPLMNAMGSGVTSDTNAHTHSSAKVTEEEELEKLMPEEMKELNNDKNNESKEN